MTQYNFTLLYYHFHHDHIHHILNIFINQLKINFED